MATRDITAQELYAPTYRDLRNLSPARVLGADTARVVQTAGNDAQALANQGNYAGAAGTTLRGALAALPAIGMDTMRAGAGLSDAVFGPWMRAGSRFGQALLGGESSRPSTQQTAPAATQAAPAPRPATTEQPQPTRTATTTSPTQALPQFRVDARSNDMAYQIDPSARGWRPQLEGRGENPNYQGPLSHINVSRDKNGTLTFSGSGRKINQDGTEHQTPAVSPTRMQQAMAEVASLFKDGQPRSERDQELAAGLLGQLLKSEDTRELYGRKAEDDIMQLMLGSKLRVQEALAARKPVSVDDQMAAQAYDYIREMYKDDPAAMVQAITALRSKQPFGMPMTGGE